MGINEQIAESAVKEMKELWGGNLPFWEDYKKAYMDGRVRGNKTIALQAINMVGVPKPYFIIYGVITLWLGYLLFPGIFFAWFFMDFSGWWILGSFFASWFLVELSREGHCEGMKAGAEINKDLYEILVCNGAFLFAPNQPNK